MKTKHCRSILREGASNAEGTPERDLSSDPELAVNARFDERSSIDEGTAVEEAKHCLAAVPCKGCDLCRLFCPDLCVTRNAETGMIEIDYDFCKGCGICAAICPRGAIKMVLEEH